MVVEEIKWRVLKWINVVANIKTVMNSEFQEKAGNLLNR
jgi:hypothetical protein